MRWFALAFALLLGGCSAGVRYILDEYTGIERREVAMPDDTYRVFDKPAASRMMVTSSIGSAMTQGAGKGVLFGAIDTTPPKPLFEAAARKYLEETGRTSCRIVDTYILVQPQFEVKYDCTPPVGSAPPSAGRQRAQGKQAPVTAVPQPPTITTAPAAMELERQRTDWDKR